MAGSRGLETNALSIADTVTLALGRQRAGAAHVWVGRSLNPALGFLAAWTFLVLSTVFMVTAALPLGVATLRLIAPAYESSAPLAADLGAEIAGLTGAALAIGVVPLVYFQARLRSPFCSDARERHPRQR